MSRSPSCPADLDDRAPKRLLTGRRPVGIGHGRLRLRPPRAFKCIQALAQRGGTCYKRRSRTEGSRHEVHPISRTAQEAELARLIVAALNLEVRANEIDPEAPLYGEGLGLELDRHARNRSRRVEGVRRQTSCQRREQRKDLQLAAEFKSLHPSKSGGLNFLASSDKSISAYPEVRSYLPRASRSAFRSRPCQGPWSSRVRSPFLDISVIARCTSPPHICFCCVAEQVYGFPSIGLASLTGCGKVLILEKSDTKQPLSRNFDHIKSMGHGPSPGSPSMENESTINGLFPQPAS